MIREPENLNIEQAARFAATLLETNGHEPTFDVELDGDPDGVVTALREMGCRVSRNFFRPNRITVSPPQPSTSTPPG